MPFCNLFIGRPSYVVFVGRVICVSDAYFSSLLWAWLLIPKHPVKDSSAVYEMICYVVRGTVSSVQSVSQSCACGIGVCY